MYLFMTVFPRGTSHRGIEESSSRTVEHDAAASSIQSLIFYSTACGQFGPNLAMFLKKTQLLWFGQVIKTVERRGCWPDCLGHCKTSDSGDETEAFLNYKKVNERKYRLISGQGFNILLCMCRLRGTSSLSCGELPLTWSASPTTVAASRNASPCTPATTRSSALL